MISEKEYRLLCRIRDELDAFDPAKLSEDEMSALGHLIAKGYIELHPQLEKSQEQFQDGKVVLDKYTGSKAKGAEKHIEPELNPGAHSIPVPTFLSHLLLSCLLGFVSGAALCFLLENIFVL